jgi:arginase
MGPSAVRYAQLHEKLHRLGYQTRDEGNVAVAQVEEIAEPPRLEINAHYLPQVAAVCQRAYDALMECWGTDEIGLFIGGDHTISIGTAAAAAKRGEIGVIWVDAHTDMNTPESSPSGNIHGMSLAVLLGDGPAELVDIGYAGAKLKPENTAIVGVRSVDNIERQRVRASGVTAYTMRDIDEQGISAVAGKVLEQFAHLDRIHVSFDLDSCDPRFAPGVGTQAIGGLTYREAHLLMEILADSGKACSMDVVEINPILDIQNRTAEVAVEMVMSLLGSRIL